jgi:hypothetical protein
MMVAQPLPDSRLAVLPKAAVHFGLAPPYRFERVLLGAFACLLMAVLAIGVLWLSIASELPRGSPRFAYFGYLTVLLILALVAVRWPRLCAVLLVLATIDIVWGLGSFALDRRNGTASLLPPGTYEPQRFQWNALLQVVPIPSLHITSNTGLSISHTSEGTRGREPRRSDVEGHVMVATVGGSSTYDVGAGDGDTWSDRLNDALGRDRYFVVNHGVPGYTTVEHLVQTTFYQAKFGRPPRCALYYVGYNDLRNAFIPHLDPGFADYHLPSQVDSLRVRRVGGSNVTFSPLLTELARLVSAEVDTVRYSADPHGAPGRGDDAGLTSLFERNLRAISAINRERGVATVWIDQLVNRAALTGEGSYGWMPLVRDRDIWPMLQRFNAVLAEVAHARGDVHVAPEMARFEPTDFVDTVHFSARGSRKFAEMVVPAVRDACR